MLTQINYANLIPRLKFFKNHNCHKEIAYILEKL